MINFSIGGERGFKAESKDNEAAELIVASAVSVSLVALAIAGAYAIANRSGENLLEGSAFLLNKFTD